MGDLMVDEKKNELKKFKMLSVVGFFVISIIGTILHFTYELSGGNLIVATFSAVNESVWEHLKIAVMPVFIWTIIELFVFCSYYRNSYPYCFNCYILCFNCHITSNWCKINVYEESKCKY